VYPRYSRDGAFVSFHTWNDPRRLGRVPPIGGSLTWLKFGDEAPQTFADLAPDGTTYAFVRADADAERVYIAASGAPPRRLTSSRSTLPRWSPDGTMIAFASDRRYDSGIFVIGADGRNERQISKTGGWPVWWPDGRQIAFIAAGPEGRGEIRVVSLADGSTRSLSSIKLGVFNHPFAVFNDGQRIVLGNAIHDVDEVWVLEPKR
jgi:Tol biopolymer transport system component